MKSAFFFLCVLLGVFLLNACLMEDWSKITVENSSDYEVKNITLTYEHGQNGKQFINIDSLKQNEKKTFNVEMQDSAIILNTFTTDIEIEYYINNKIFNIENDENVKFYEDGTPYNYSAFIGGGHSITFIIKNDSYIVR